MNAVLLLISFSLPLTVQSQETSQKVINQVVDVYGTNNLIKSNNLKIIENFKSIMKGQSITPDMMNLISLKREVIIDFNKAVAQETRSYQRREITFYNRNIFKDKKHYVINLVNNTYAEPQEAKIENVIGHTMLLNDIGLAKLLLENAQTAKLLAIIDILTIPHFSIELTVPVYGKLNLFINKNNGLITRMTREHSSFGTIRTEFSNVIDMGKYQYAKETELFYNNELALVVLNREVTLNSKLAKDFSDISKFSANGKDLYPSEMLVRELSDNVFLVGKHAVHSLFIVNGNNVIGVESYKGITERFNALKKHLNKSLVLTDLVITHHHSDHISGVNEVAELGANMITVKSHLDELKTKLGNKAINSQFKLVDQKLNLNNNEVQIFDIATSHSLHNLVVYIPTLKLMFTADYFRSSYQNEKVLGYPGLVPFRNNIDKLNLDIEKFASVHGIRVLSYQQLVDATEGYEIFECGEYQAICNETKRHSHL